MTETHLMARSLAEMVALRSGEEVNACYGCRKCTAGCPTAGYMDHSPDAVLRMVQMGFKDQLLRSNSPWLCVGCETCFSRCPNRINIGRIMDVLKELAFDEGATSGEKNVVALHRAFLDSIRFLGRVHEGSMLVEYKVRSGDLAGDLDLGVLMMLKGKIRPLPERVEGIDEIRGIYDASGSRIAEGGEPHHPECK